MVTPRLSVRFAALSCRARSTTACTRRAARRERKVGGMVAIVTAIATVGCEVSWGSLQDEPLGAQAVTGIAGGAGLPGAGGQSAAGAAGSPQVDFSLVEPVERGAVLTWELGPLQFTVDPATGARVTQASYGGKELLLSSADVVGTPNANNYGATFWTSPQSSWGWPPVATLDSLPYAVDTARLPVVTLTSDEAAMPDGSILTVSKTVVPLALRGAVELQYVLHNASTTATTVAPWQVARVRGEGLTFFALGAGGIDRDFLGVTEVEGVAWLQYDPTPTGSGAKLFADARGWVAHVVGNLLLVQRFPDLSPGAAATGEAELELYADPARSYLEIEPQGAAAVLAPGKDSAVWSVRWLLRELPVGTEVAVGSPALLEQVSALLEQ
jgi:hypothetical protein